MEPILIIGGIWVAFIVLVLIGHRLKYRRIMWWESGEEKPRPWWRSYRDVQEPQWLRRHDD